MSGLRSTTRKTGYLITKEIIDNGTPNRYHCNYCNFWAWWPRDTARHVYFNHVK